MLAPVTKGYDRLGKMAALLEAQTPQAVYLTSREVFNRKRRRMLAAFLPEEGDAAHLAGLTDGADCFQAVSICELSHYMRNTLLRDTDCMAMAHSLEVRVPFIDTDVVRTVLGMPSSAKIDTTRPKSLLLDSIMDLIPEEIWHRPKQGFLLPLEDWMTGHLRTEIGDTFAGHEQLRRVGLNPSAVDCLWRRFLRHPKGIGWARPWALYALAKWGDGVGMFTG